MNEILRENFLHIRSLASDIERHIVRSEANVARLENELAGMFAVTIVATYEEIVRSTLIGYAAQHNEKFKTYIEADLAKTNARISLSDLYKYSRKFGLPSWSGPGVKKNATTFHRMLDERRPKIENRLRQDLFQSYGNIFDWRNAYAHERATNATLRDVYNSHRVAKYVIYTFVEAFEAK